MYQRDVKSISRCNFLSYVSKNMYVFGNKFVDKLSNFLSWCLVQIGDLDIVDVLFLVIHVAGWVQCCVFSLDMTETIVCFFFNFPIRIEHLFFLLGHHRLWQVINRFFLLLCDFDFELLSHGSLFHLWDCVINWLWNHF